MSAPTNNVIEAFDVQETAAAPMAETRPLYWSVRRELWENRSIYLAPLIVAGFVLFATLIGTLGLPKKMRNLPTVDPAKQHAVVVRPFSMAPAPIMFTTFLVGMFYAVDALYGERRDRSILFWKSLPVSDRTTVLSKATIPLVVLPLIAFALSVVTFTILLCASTAWLVMNGVSPVRLWAEVRVVQEPAIMLYGLTVHALWFAPIYCWLLLVGAWSRRAPFLWAVLPPLAIAAVERAAFSTSYFVSMLQYRVVGAMQEAFSVKDNQILDRVTQLTPGRFLTSPGLWVGLAFAFACVVLAARLRRNREPI